MKSNFFKVLYFLYFAFSLLYLIPYGFADCCTKHGWDFFRGLAFILLGAPSLWFLSLIRGTNPNSPSASVARYALVVIIGIGQYLYIKQIIQTNSNKQNLEKALQLLDRPVATTRYSNGIIPLHDELQFFDSIAMIIDQGAKIPDEDIRQLAAQLKSKLSGVQINEFPVMRQEYANNYSTQLQKYGTAIFTQGTGNSILNIVDTSLTSVTIGRIHIDENAEKLRFKEIRYKKTTGDIYYTTHKLNTPDDETVVKTDVSVLREK